MASVLPDRQVTAWISSQRPPRAARPDPGKPNAVFLERERGASGRIVESGVVLLTSKECPWRCLMCDLWKHTTTQAVPAGAIPAQIAQALQTFPGRTHSSDSRLVEEGPAAIIDQIKLYNSGSFFDPAAIPPADYADIAQRISRVPHVIVESHPRLVGERTWTFRDRLAGSLEVAMGLETVHPEILPRLNKKFTLTHFADAAKRLQKEGIALRAFVLVQPPFLDEGEGAAWAVRSAEFAFSCGATAVSLIPTRGGNGAMERLLEAGEFAPPRLASLEQALERSLDLGAGRVFADTWDLEQFSSCANCFERRKQRLEEMNLMQRKLPAIACPHCGGT